MEEAWGWLFAILVALAFGTSLIFSPFLILGIFVGIEKGVKFVAARAGWVFWVLGVALVVAVILGFVHYGVPPLTD